MTKLTSSNGLITFNVPATPKPKKSKAKVKPKDGSAGPKALTDLLRL